MDFIIPCSFAKKENKGTECDKGGPSAVATVGPGTDISASDGPRGVPLVLL